MASGWWNDIARWGQVNLRDIDPQATDVEWWTRYWQDCGVGAVTVNAGGIVAFYPTRVEYHRRSIYLGDRDLFGEFLTSLRRSNIRVLARFTASRQHADMYAAHPDWFARGADGQPVVEHPVGRDPVYNICPSGPFHYEWLPAVVDEVQDAYRPDGVFSNLWNGVRGVCYCPRCREGFREATGFELPARLTPEDLADEASRRYQPWRLGLHRRWVDFMQARVKKHTPDATFVVNQPKWIVPVTNWEDLRELTRRSDVIDSDFQGRGLSEGAPPLWAIGENGRALLAAAGRRPGGAVVCGLSGAFDGWRLAAKGEAEQTIWLADIAAAGVRPWLHFVGAAQGGMHDDPRRFSAPRSYLAWHRDNEDCFRDLDSLAEVAVLISKTSKDQYGGRASRERVFPHQHGVSWSLIRAGIPFDFLHDADLLEPDAPSLLARYRVLILPNVACLSDAQASTIRAWVDSGGGIVATHETGLYTEDLRPRGDSVLSDVFGATSRGERVAAGNHWYIRAEAAGAPLLAGLQDLCFFAGGGDVLGVAVSDGAVTGLTLLPPIPSMPPEAAYFEVERTGHACAVLNRHGAGRSVYFPFPLDALAWTRGHPDHAAILANAVRWAAGWSAAGEDAGAVPASGSVSVSAPGIIDMFPYRQPDGSVVVHLVNVGHVTSRWGPIEHLTPVGPVTLRFSGEGGRRVAQAVGGSGAELRRLGGRAPLQDLGESVLVTVPSVRDFEAVRFPGVAI